MSAGYVPRPVQTGVIGAVVALLLVGASWLGTNYSGRHSALFLLGAGLGLVLYQSAFGFGGAFRVFVTDSNGRGLRAQMLMLAVATLLFAPLLASGHALGQVMGGAVAPADGSVVAGAFMFAIGMQLGGG
jgi:hypothetical protein